MAVECAADLKKHNIAFVSLWPGPVRTEHINNFIDEISASEAKGEVGLGGGLVLVSNLFLIITNSYRQYYLNLYILERVASLSVNY